jgi:CTP-dependent riboflavin kinase
MNELEMKVLEAIRAFSTTPGKTVDANPDDIIKKVGISNKEYEKILISLKETGYVYAYTGLVAGLTEKGFRKLEKKYSLT